MTIVTIAVLMFTAFMAESSAWKNVRGLVEASTAAVATGSTDDHRKRHDSNQVGIGALSAAKGVMMRLVVVSAATAAAVVELAASDGTAKNVWRGEEIMVETNVALLKSVVLEGSAGQQK
jgi:hypothetical protein